MDLLAYIDRIPSGYSEAFYKERKYGLTKEIFNQGKSFKIFAEELGGNDFISLNEFSRIYFNQSQFVKICLINSYNLISSDYLRFTNSSIVPSEMESPMPGTLIVSTTNMI